MRLRCHYVKGWAGKFEGCNEVASLHSLDSISLRAVHTRPFMIFCNVMFFGQIVTVCLCGKHWKKLRRSVLRSVKKHPKHVAW